MKKSTLNFIIDGLMLICLCAVSGIGFLIKYTLPSGQVRWEKYGSNVEILWLNLDRHQWGSIHLIAGILMLLLLVAHIILHITFIKATWAKIVKLAPTRIVIGAIFCLISLLLIVFPFIIQPQINNANTGNHHIQAEHSISSNKVPKQTHTASKETESTNHNLHNISGRMTLGEVCNQYNIPECYIKKQLNIASNVSSAIRLGQLRKHYSFHMSDVEKAINKYKNTSN